MSDLGNREHGRIALRVSVTFESDRNFYLGFTENLSEGGLFVATPERFPVGMLLDVELTLPGRESAPVVISGRVRWVCTTPQGADMPVGMGLAFEGLPPDAGAAIASFIRRREPIFYEH